MFKERGEFLILAGLAVWCAMFAPFFPILWLIAQLLLGPGALALLALGAWQARDRAASRGRLGVGAALLLLGLAALWWTSLQTVNLAFKGFSPPDMSYARLIDAWLRTIASWFVPAILCGLGLRWWTSWSGRRCLAWAAVVLGVHGVELMGFWLVSLTNPPRGA
jgi:hypothetical protein